MNQGKIIIFDAERLRKDKSDDLTKMCGLFWNQIMDNEMETGHGSCLLWLGDPERARQSGDVFWDRFAEYLAEKGNGMQQDMKPERLEEALGLAAKYPPARIRCMTNGIVRVLIDKVEPYSVTEPVQAVLPKGVFLEIVGGSGLDLSKLEETDECIALNCSL